MSCFGFSREQRERINRLNVRKQLQRLLNEDNYVIQNYDKHTPVLMSLWRKEEL